MRTLRTSQRKALKIKDNLKAKNIRKRLTQEFEDEYLKRPASANNWQRIRTANILKKGWTTEKRGLDIKGNIL
ncbi:MAG: hypothetical protein J7L34_06520 [Thermotogaceae bacterium]|nr:hypothetical protein [Thermotogaceae bacterium]